MSHKVICPTVCTSIGAWLWLPEYFGDPGLDPHCTGHAINIEVCDSADIKSAVFARDGNIVDVVIGGIACQPHIVQVIVAFFRAVAIQAKHISII